MKYIQSKADLKLLPKSDISTAILATMKSLEHSCQEPYQATLHGWFIICEQETDLSVDFPHLTFSLKDKLDLGEVEYVDKKPDWYEVYIMLNDNEGVLVFVPKMILEQYQLKAHQQTNNNAAHPH
ncbi:hypothetical protein [Acinetobacter rathckeae]|uniref:hypothetical protein n=1 Tax=Acinetobacter rathckeae TaxID=2605272 RepID=UPI0018A3380D|nr:hypothetical protein [Acinetobacter rathckeae]MBF7695117.1 hypothetical protein [Acinetobacter rathckeae]